MARVNDLSSEDPVKNKKFTKRKKIYKKKKGKTEKISGPFKMMDQHRINPKRQLIINRTSVINKL